jgi:hypothetical protein
MRLCFFLDQHAELGFYSASSLKQQSVGRHVAPLGHIILIPSQPVFALSPYCCVLRGEATNTNFYSLWFDPTRAPTYDLLHSRIAVDHYATNVVTTDGSRGPLPTSSVNVAIQPPKSRGITGQFIISVVVFFLQYTAHPMVMISLEICRK